VLALAAHPRLLDALSGTGKRMRARGSAKGAALQAIAQDLQQHKGRVLLHAGREQPASVQAAALAINHALGAFGETVHFIEPVAAAPADQAQSLAALVEDMKAGVAAFVLAGQAFARSNRRLRGNLVLHAVADETAGGMDGTGYLSRQGRLQGDFAVVCEPTGLDVFIAHRGLMYFELVIEGRAAHSGRPWLGVNAIDKASNVMQELTRSLGPVFAQRTHAMLPSPSINFARIEGGARESIVAARCRLGEARLARNARRHLVEPAQIGAVEGLERLRQRHFPAASCSGVKNVPTAKSKLHSSRVGCRRFATSGSLLLFLTMPRGSLSLFL